MDYAELVGNDEGKSLLTTLNLNFAMACIKGGYYQEGIDAATIVIATEGAATHGKAYYWRATGYFNLADHKQCIADCMASVKLQPKNKVAKFYIPQCECKYARDVESFRDTTVFAGSTQTLQEVFGSKKESPIRSKEAQKFVQWGL